MTAEPRTLDDIRALIAKLARGLDPHSRYLPELLALLDASRDLADLERRLLAGCRGLRHAGPDVFAAMSLREKILANLVTPETTLFRFTEGEMEALDREILPRLHGRTARILIVPCSLGDEAFTMAAYLLKVKIEFEIEAFDIQPQLIEIARAGRLTFGYPLEYLAAPGCVGEDVLRRIRFQVADAFALPSPSPLKGEGAGGEGAGNLPGAAQSPPQTSPSSASPRLGGESSYDIVLCRNFIGYFVPKKALELARKLAAQTAPGGVLFLDGFCLQKFPALAPDLAARGFRRQGDRPVFLHGGPSPCPT